MSIATASAPPSLLALSEVISEAHESRTPLRIQGAGTWLDAGRPVHGALPLLTRQHAGVTEYVPGDLVISARAGTTLGEIAEVTAEHDQWLALDPFGAVNSLDAMTIGACIATASSGPLAHGYGRVRDLVLGLSFLAGDGTAVRAGGRVVKNVAGFDLVRLSVGAWGTLGVITDVSLRLHARPALDRTFVIALDVPPGEAARESQRAALISLLNTAPMLATTSTLSALVLIPGDAALSVATAHGIACDANQPPLLLVARALGNATRVAAQRTALQSLGHVSDVDTSIWRTLRSLGRSSTSFRLGGAPLETTTTWHRVESWLARHEAHAQLVVEPMRGLVRVMASLRGGDQHAFELPAGALPEQLPAGAWSMQPSPVEDRVSQQIRRAFDPMRILNPGIFGEVTGVSSDAIVRSEAAL